MTKNVENFCAIQSLPTLSACLIVRNEAHCLARCLDSLQGLVSEIIVVDTGSTDGTVDIARKYTDKIFHYAWNDHFAEARNFGLAQATGDWILIIDADEVIPQETATLIPSYLTHAEFQDRPLVLNFRFCAKGRADLFSRGLFPNGYGISFAGRVHEIPVLAGQILPSYHCQELVVWHESQMSRSKLRNYERLLKQSLSEESDPALINHLQKHLGLTQLQLHDCEGAWETLTKCHQGMIELGLRPQDDFFGEVLQGLVHAGTLLGKPEVQHDRLFSQPCEKLEKPRFSSVLSPFPRWRKSLFALCLSTVAACQPATTISPASLKKSNPIILKPDHVSVSAQPNHLSDKSEEGSFKIQSVYFCPPEQADVLQCYSSGGFPVADLSGPLGEDANGFQCYHLLDCQESLRFNFTAKHLNDEFVFEIDSSIPWSLNVTDPLGNVSDFSGGKTQRGQPLILRRSAPAALIEEGTYYAKLNGTFPGGLTTFLDAYIVIEHQDFKAEYPPLSEAQSTLFSPPANVFISPRNHDGSFDAVVLKSKIIDPGNTIDIIAADPSSLPQGASSIIKSINVDELAETWDGTSEQGICVPDGEYKAILKTSDSAWYQTFYVDNTPPIVKGLDIQEVVTQTLPDELVDTTVSFTIEDPSIYGSASGILTNKWALTVSLDDTFLYATPLLDENGFWLTSEIPASDLQISDETTTSAKVTFHTTGRMAGRTLTVSAWDRVGNYASYIVYPRGGGF